MSFLSTITLLVLLLNTLSCSDPRLHHRYYPDCTSKDIEMMDSCLIGLRLRDAIQKIDVDTSQTFVVDEPPGILRGVSISQKDTCVIRIYVPRTSIFDSSGSFYDIDRKNISEIGDKKVIGVTWRKYKDKKEVSRNSIGNTIWQWGD
jgi:hypothetical protein